MRAWTVLALAMCAASAARGQWVLQESGSTASLRGIDAVSREVAWASGSEGTVLRTVDGGKHWIKCAVPEGAEKLDFRGVQAFDAETAIVMSSGAGDLSRLYKTLDECRTWRLLFTNPDKDGFWDAIQINNRHNDRDHGRYSDGFILGDPVHGAFYLAKTFNGGTDWYVQHNKRLKADSKMQGAFAASNSSLLLSDDGFPLFVTGGLAGAMAYNDRSRYICLDAGCGDEVDEGLKEDWKQVTLPVGQRATGSGAFSIAGKESRKGGWQVLVSVGGDYQRADAREATSAFSTDQGITWTASTAMPGGYRSAVAYDDQQRVWITVGPNGTDISFDDGKNWKALRPGKENAADADQHWNALSLPFVVGSKGRIGVLRDGAVEEVRR